APFACGLRSGTFSRLKCARVSTRWVSCSSSGPLLPTERLLRSLTVGAPLTWVEGPEASRPPVASALLSGCEGVVDMCCSSFSDGVGNCRCGASGPIGGALPGIGTRGADAPVDDLRLVDGEAVVVGRLEARGLAGSALHVDHRAAAAADEVVVVVTELELVARGVTGRFEAPDEPGAGEGGEDVVDSLGAHRAEPLTGTPGDGLDIR